MAANLEFSSKALEDFGWWVKNDLKKVKRIYELLDSIASTPFDGIGKPEALKGNLSGYWSRRITDEYGIVYKLSEGTVYLLQMKGHY